jgi:hypothetical protein
VNIPTSGAAEASAGAAASGKGPSFSHADLSRFESALSRADSGGVPGEPSQAMQVLMKPFEHLDSQAAGLSEKAAQTVAAGHSMTPGEMILMTVRCQEFMFHCQLTSNAANRTSDGLQQLFRQQS